MIMRGMEEGDIITGMEGLEIRDMIEYGNNLYLSGVEKWIMPRSIEGM